MTNKTIEQSVPEEAVEVLTKRESHGEAVENHRHIAQLWSAFLGYDISSRDVADCMTLLKMVRGKDGDVIKDHDVDRCGYSGIAYACAVADGEAEDV